MEVESQEWGGIDLEVDKSEDTKVSIWRSKILGHCYHVMA
jgi:hypothetical protein